MGRVVDDPSECRSQSFGIVHGNEYSSSPLVEPFSRAVRFRRYYRRADLSRLQ